MTGQGRGGGSISGRMCNLAPSPAAYFQLWLLPLTQQGLELPLVLSLDQARPVATDADYLRPRAAQKVNGRVVPGVGLGDWRQRGQTQVQGDKRQQSDTGGVSGRGDSRASTGAVSKGSGLLSPTADLRGQILRQPSNN